MNRQGRLCVVGSANVDMTFRTPRLPQAGETLSGRSLHVGMGGKGANQAVAAARLGAQVALVACVGNDAFGGEAIRRYQAEGVDASFVRQDPDRPTGTAAIVVDDDAENFIVVAPGANAGLSPADATRASSAIHRADAVLCQLETPLETTVEAFRLAREAGKLTILTPAPVMELPDELLRCCDLCVPNRTETAFFAGRPVENRDDAQAAADAIRARGVRAVVVTMSGDGAFLFDEAGSLHIPATPVEAVDTTGAGDSFMAALAVWLAEGLPLREAARRASLAAAMTVTRIGAQTAFPSRAEVDEQLASGGPNAIAK